MTEVKKKLFQRIQSLLWLFFIQSLWSLWWHSNPFDLLLEAGQKQVKMDCIANTKVYQWSKPSKFSNMHQFALISLISLKILWQKQYSAHNIVGPLYTYVNTCNIVLDIYYITVLNNIFLIQNFRVIWKIQYDAC